MPLWKISQVSAETLFQYTLATVLLCFAEAGQSRYST